MDDESIINETGNAFNGNWRAVLLASGLLLLSFLYLTGKAIGAVFTGLISLIGG